jgi:HK97 family phage prohead protease
VSTDRIVRQVVTPLQFTESAPNRSKLIAATNKRARDGHILATENLDYENFMRTGAVLFDHDSKIPVAVPVSAELKPNGDLEIEIEWAPDDISEDVRKVKGLVKNGILRAGSVGFDVLDSEPLDPKRPRDGSRITRSELLELSIVAVPADPGAVVTQRSAADWKCGASRDLPIDDSDEWDGSAAEASIFTWAGGDDFDPSKARKGFLAYNAAKPKERGSYKLPIAHIVDGRLKVPKGAIRAAASRLSQTEIPDETKTAAQAVIDHYEEKAGMAKKEGDRSISDKFRRSIESVRPVFKRGLYDVAHLAHMLECLGYAHSSSEFEAAIEGDDSPVPAMLGEVLTQFGKALIAMTEEEVGELLEGKDLELDEPDVTIIKIEERAYIEAAKTPRTRAWRRGITIARAGKTLSATNEQKLEQAQDHLDRAMKHHKTLGEHQEAVGGHLDAITAQQSKASEAHGELGEALHAVKNEPEKATEHVARAFKAHKAVGSQLDDMGEAATDMKDRHQDLGDSHEALGRCVRSAQRCVRGVVEGASPAAEGEDGDSKNVQTSAGTEDSGGSKNDRSLDRKRRKRDLEALAGIARSYS